MRRLLLVLAVLWCAAACGEDDAGGDPGPVTVGEALEQGGRVVVRGALFVEASTVRLCEAVMESYPPQCGGRDLVVEGLDVAVLELERPKEPGHPDVRWSRGQVTLEGQVEGDRLLGARVSG